MTPSQYEKNKNLKYYWMAAYFLLGSGIPLILLFIEYGRSIPDNVSTTTVNEFREFIPDVITAYSPLFIYGCLVGFLLPLYIIPAYGFFKTSIRYGKSKRALKRFVIAAICVAVLVAIADFFGGDAAIWEIKPPKHQAFVNHFVNADKNTSIEAKTAYKEGITNTLGEGVSNWSLIRYSYFFSVLIEAFFLNVFFYLCFLYYAFRRALKFEDAQEFYKRGNGLIISSLLVFIWVILRISNGLEKSKLYPSINLHVAEIAVGVLNIMCLFAVVLARLNNKKIRKVAEDIFWLLAALGISISSIFTLLNKESLPDYFGKKAVLANYLVFPVVFLLLYAAYYIVNMGSEFNHEYNIPKDDDDFN